MTVPNEQDRQAVAALVGNASASVSLDALRRRLDDLTGNDFPTVAALLDLLADSAKVSANTALLGQIAAVKRVFVRLWEDCEQAVAMGD